MPRSRALVLLLGLVGGASGTSVSVSSDENECFVLGLDESDAIIGNFEILTTLPEKGLRDVKVSVVGPEPPREVLYEVSAPGPFRRAPAALVRAPRRGERSGVLTPPSASCCASRIAHRRARAKRMAPSWPKPTRRATTTCASRTTTTASSRWASPSGRTTSASPTASCPRPSQSCWRASRRLRTTRATCESGKSCSSRRAPSSASSCTSKVVDSPLLCRNGPTTRKRLPSKLPS